MCTYLRGWTCVGLRFLSSLSRRTPNSVRRKFNPVTLFFLPLFLLLSSFSPSFSSFFSSFAFSFPSFSCFYNSFKCRLYSPFFLINYVTFAGARFIRFAFLNLRRRFLCHEGRKGWRVAQDWRIGKSFSFRERSSCRCLSFCSRSPPRILLSPFFHLFSTWSIFFFFFHLFCLFSFSQFFFRRGGNISTFHVKRECLLST